MKQIVAIAGVMRPTLYTRNLILQASRAYASDFFHVYQKARSGPVKKFLLGHALELSLKAFLLSKSAKQSDLKNYGHRLDRLLFAAQHAGLNTVMTISPELIAAV